MTTIVIADDHGLVRAGIRSLLERESEFEVLGEAGDGQQALTLVEQFAPDVLLIDLSMPRLNGVEALKRLKELHSKTRTIVISMHEAEGVVLGALRAGAKGYLLKDSLKEELFFAIRAAARGEIYLSPRLANTVLAELISVPGDASLNPLERLSSREREVLQLILEDRTNRQIADTLNLSVKTVDKHRGNLMKKLDVHNVGGLIQVAMQYGMLYVGKEKPLAAKKQ